MIQFIISIFSSFGILTIENKRKYEIKYKKLTKALLQTEFSINLGSIKVKEKVDLKEEHEKFNSLNKCCTVCYFEDLQKKFKNVYFRIFFKNDTAIDLRNNKIRLFFKKMNQIPLIEHKWHVLAFLIPNGDKFDIQLFYIEKCDEIYYVSAVLSECKEIRKACLKKMDLECTIL